MVEITAYSPSMFELAQGLMLSQKYVGFDVITPEGLPKCGFIAHDSATLLAMGFLRIVEGGYAQIDTLVSNGDLSSAMRHEGISMVVNALIEQAKVLKLKGIIAFSEDTGVLSRAEALGFKTIPQTIIVLSL